MGRGRGLRTGRAAVFAAVCVLLASLGHVLMSRTAVPWWTLAAAFAAIGALAWWLADRERGPLLVTGLTVGLQAVLHALFALGQAAAGSGAPDGSGLAAQWAELLLCGPGHPSPAEVARLVRSAGLDAVPTGGGLTVEAVDVPGTDTAGTPGTAMAGMPGMDMGVHAQHAAAAMPAHHAGAGLGMLAAHMVAAVLIGLWLSAGERAVFRLGRTVSARLFAPLLLLIRSACPPHRPRVRAARRGSSQRLRRLLLVHALTSRGPPAGAAAV